MKLAFLVDPLPKLKVTKDSSIAMMRAAQARGHEIWTCQREGLCWEEGAVWLSTQLIALTDGGAGAWYEVVSEARVRADQFDALLMRQDPPFDFEYLTATWLLERAEAQGARVWNRPRAIRDHSEKLSILEFPQFTPATMVARDPERIHAFIDALGDVILKPLDGMGGSQIFRVHREDHNRYVIVETLTHHGHRTIMAQEYLPQIRDGDKRVLVIAGEVLPYALARIPQPGETRGNLAAGGRGVAVPLTEAEREVAEALAPILWQRGLLIVGLDLIGGRLTEINVTSPTCMVEIAAQTGFSAAERVIEALERLSAG